MSWFLEKAFNEANIDKSNSLQSMFSLECLVDKPLNKSHSKLTCQAKLIKDSVLTALGSKPIDAKISPMSCKAIFIDGVVIVGTVAEIANIAIGMRLGFGR